ncbi:hypothetical protein DVT68_11565 [Dyella solisilvae]|uniref:PNPLA domain-containing protein n=1 Tax=Dyella solisilvae TaxID=1920168 RepID=A0A370K8Y9_9GAMM|nr:hypothetical protein [Dyella solisilvae]RDI99109.1 hypothetical protein DVT68_11565 [Dyella solisilvae]
MIGWTALVLDHLKPVRVSLLVLAIATVVVVSVDQAAELFLIALWTDPSAGRYLGLLASAALTGLASWYAARNAYRLRYPRWPALQDARAAPLRDWIPRVLGAAVPLLVCIGYVVALAKLPHGPCGGDNPCVQRSWRAFGLLLESMALIAFFLIRRRVWLAMSRRMPALRAPGARPSDENRVWRVRDLGRTPCSIYAGVIALNILLTIVIAWRPEALDGIGPLAIVLISAGFLCISGSLLCMVGDRRGMPLLSAMLLLSASLHWLHLNDNHRVRQYPSMSTHQQPSPPPPDTRVSFDAYLDGWLDDRCAHASPCPVILVSAEGGGIRGAAWTALVLARLTAAVEPAGRTGAEPLFARYLLAGSGVSGGSLGLATYVSLLAQPPATDAGTLEARAQTLLGHDFLAPTLANAFFVDFTQRWLPGAWLDDRSRALTRAWESAARQQGLDAFAQPFAALYAPATSGAAPVVPALFFNSTTVVEGKRFIQHPFQPIATPQRQPWTAGLDGSSWLDPRVPLSEVVLNSARFTYISPAGTLETRASNPPVPNRLQLVDGGYFENSGATTLLEVMRLVRTRARARGQSLRFIVIHISNDPQMTDFVDRHDPRHPLPLYTTSCPPAPGGVRDRVVGEAIAPVQALLETRSARGEYARVQLLRALQPDDADPARGDMLWHFRLCPGDYPIPMGWTISAPVFTELDRQLRQQYPLAVMGQALRQQLTPTSP